MGRFGYFCRFVIANFGRQCGNQHKRAFHECINLVLVGFNANNAIVRKGDAGLADKRD